MIRVYSTDNLIQAGYIQGLLEARGIECVMRNTTLSSGMGELPLNECWPEVWILDDRDRELAERIIHEALDADNEQGDSNRTTWLCDCGEWMESQFDSCWKCGKLRPE